MSADLDQAEINYILYRFANATPGQLRVIQDALLKIKPESLTDRAANTELDE